MKRCILYALLLFPLLVFSAPPPPPKDDTPKPGGEVWNEQLETILIARLTRILEMKPDQAKEFFPLLNDFQDKNKSLRKEHQELMMRLHQLGDPSSTATAPEVDRTIKALSENQKSMMQSVSSFMADASKVLQPWQVARLQVFIIRFPERVEQIMRERMGGNMEGMHHGGGRMRGREPEPDEDK